MSIQIVEIAQPSVIDTVAVAQPSTVAVVEVRQGPAGTGGSGSNSVTSETTSDGTADLSLLNVTTATAEVTGTLTANHIHGNLAGNVYAHVRAGEALLKGDPVYVSGSYGSGSTLIAIVSKADASNAAKMPAVGIMDADLANNATGHMVIVGTITELNTAGYSINAELYVAAGGGMTATPPTARAQPVARVERSNANNGAILVKVNGLSASDATPSTLVRRDASGGSTFLELYANAAFIGDLNTSGGIQADGPIIAEAAVTFQATSPITFDSTSYTYGAGAASAHRTALGSGATGDALFRAASASAARVIALNEILKYDPNAAATRTNPAAYADDDTLAGVSLTAGLWEISFYAAFDTGTCGVNKQLLFTSPSNIDAVSANHLYGNYYRGNQALAAMQVNTSTGVITLGNSSGALSNWQVVGSLVLKITGASTLSLQYVRNSNVAVQTIIRRAGAFLRARKING